MMNSVSGLVDDRRIAIGNGPGTDDRVAVFVHDTKSERTDGNTVFLKMPTYSTRGREASTRSTASGDKDPSPGRLAPVNVRSVQRTPSAEPDGSYVDPLWQSVAATLLARSFFARA